MEIEPIKIIKCDGKEFRTSVIMDDFYQKTGLFPLIKEGTVKDVTQIWMNRKQCEEMREQMKKNAKKDKRFKGFTDKYIATQIGFDWLMYAPVASYLVPYDQLWIWAYEDMETAMQLHRDLYAESKAKEEQTDDSETNC